MGIFGKNDPNVVKIHGIKIGPADPNGWTAEDVRSWNLDEDGIPGPVHFDQVCNYVGKITGKCKRTAESGNARCSRHIGKISVA